jgi:hypothetical protein
MTGFTPHQLIEQYIKLRNTKKAIVAEHDAVVAKYDVALEAIENEIFGQMNAQGVKQLKSDAGTAFQATTLHVRLVDRQAVNHFALDNNGGFGIFTNAVSKDFVKDWIEQKGSPPPGVEPTYITKVQIRKA